jgi:hypothetical protein
MSCFHTSPASVRQQRLLFCMRSSAEAGSPVSVLLSIAGELPCGLRNEGTMLELPSRGV